MAVALRGYTQGTTQSDGDASIAWPSGTASGDLALLVSQDYSKSGPKTSTGWTRYGEGLWAKRVTSSDIAANLECWGRTTFLQTFTGAAGVGKVRWSYGITLTVAGAGLFVDGWGPSRVSTITPGATDRLGSQIRLVTDDTPNAVWFKAATTAVYTALSDHDDDCTYVAYELLPTAGPNAPVLVSPAAGVQVDNSVDLPLEWLHQSTSSLSQTGYKARIRTPPTSGTWNYVKSDGTLTTTETAVTSGTQASSIDAGQLTSGSTYEWQVATTEDGSVWSSYSAAQTVYPVAKPTVTSITPTSPAGDLTPTIAWTMTAGSGSQTAWQVRICPSADATPDVPLWDSGVTSGTALSTTAPATTAWTSGATLYAWVRVQQTGGLWSAWTKDDATFTVSWTLPTAPSSVSATNPAGGGPVQVTVSGIDAAADGLQVQMSVDGGTTWDDLVSMADPGGTWTSQVVEAPLAPYGNTQVKFRARIWDTNGDLVDLYSAWTTSSAITPTTTLAFLVDDTDRTAYLTVEVDEDDDRTLVQGVSVTYGLGATRPRVDRSEPAGETGQTTLLTWTQADRDAVVAWLSERDVWWLRWSPERADSTVAVPATRMALAKPVGWSRVQQVDIQPRTVTFAWVEQ